MLEDLRINNGVMYPKFDKYNNVYTITIENDINTLAIDYELLPNTVIDIVGNENLKVGENIIYLNISGKNNGTYTLYVNKKEEQKATSMLDQYQVIEAKKEIPGFVGPLIGIICFLLIILSYVLLFSKKKSND